MRSPTALSIAMIAALITLGGCASAQSPAVASANGNNAAADATASQGPDLDPQERMLKFAQCMRDNGVDMPDPEFDGNGGMGVRIGGENQSMEDVEKAMEACRQYAPNGGEAPGPPDPAMQENLLKFSQCMRDNGVEAFPDPEGNMMRLDSDVAQDPDFEAAQEKCAKEFLPGAVTSRGGQAT